MKAILTRVAFFVVYRGMGLNFKHEATLKAPRQCKYIVYLKPITLLRNESIRVVYKIHLYGTFPLLCF